MRLLIALKIFFVFCLILSACDNNTEPNPVSAEEARMLKDSLEFGYVETELSPLNLYTKLPHGWSVEDGTIFNKEGKPAGRLEPGFIETDTFYSAQAFIGNIRNGGPPIITEKGDTLFKFPQEVKFIDDGTIRAPIGTWHYIITQGFVENGTLNGDDMMTEIRYPVYYAINVNSQLLVIQLYILRSLLEEKSLHQRILLNIRGEDQEVKTDFTEGG